MMLLWRRIPSRVTGCIWRLPPPRTTRNATVCSAVDDSDSRPPHIHLKCKPDKAIAVLTAAYPSVYSTAIRFGVPERYVFAFRP